MKRTAIIRIEFPSEKLAETTLKALFPETKKPSTSRSKVTVESENNNLTIKIEATDTSAVRAALNSYLRWVALAKDAYDATVSLENT